jgi:hypothetical protein
MTNTNANMGLNLEDLIPTGVFIVASAEGLLVNPYKTKPDYGWMKVQSEQLVTEGANLRPKTRTALVKADVRILTKLADVYGTDKPLPGRIYVHEYLEPQLPQNLRERFLNSEHGYEEAIKDHVKVHTKTKAVMLQNGERIIRFSQWDMTGKIEDIAVTATATAPAVPKQEAYPVFPAGEVADDLPF